MINNLNKGLKIVVDMGYESYMSTNECNSLGMQLGFGINTLKNTD